MLALNHKCSGCTACAQICHKKAIEMKADCEGFFYPHIDMEKCVNCMKCEKICPVININNYNKNNELSLCYSGYTQIPSELKTCASGGIATVISKEVIKNGMLVFGCRYSDDFSYAYYDYAVDEDDLQLFKSSKYIQARKGNSFEQIKNFLNQDKSVLFIGLPCDVAGLLAFLGKKHKNLYTIDLICHGATSEKVNDEYVRIKEKEYGSKVVYMNLREKIAGWVPPYLCMRFQNGKVFSEPFHNTEYGVAFAEFSRNYCYNCEFKGDNRPSDITIGDYWGLKEHEEGWNSDGVSILFVHSEKGKKIVENLNDVFIMAQDKEKAEKHNPCYNAPRKDTGRRKRYAKNFTKNGLLYACQHKLGLNSKIRIQLSHIYHKVIKNK